MTKEEIEKQIHAKLTINADALIETYTDDEVKTLNIVTDGDCIFGLLDLSIPVAIIGVPFDTIYKHFITVKFAYDEKQKECNFIQLSQDELKDRTFIVYPLKQEYVDNPQLKKIEESIAKYRINRMKEVENQKIKKLDK